MALKNFKVEQEDGTSTFYQFDESTDDGKAQLQVLKDAVKNPDNGVKSVTQADPEPINAKTSRSSS